ncbi:MAG: hypothetical protein KIT46_03430 [Anaerolineales bacterium]|nr:hypothetical protein [Anaerolineales bacterium]MCW5855078.1 hypothetical protein [Anaerolineales bacterium]
MAKFPAISPKIQLWLQRGTWSLADQWLFSGANFIANILLARWLQPEAFGAFALSFAIFLFFGAVHTAVLSDPMLIFAAGRFRAHQGAYLRFLLRGHLGFSLLATALLGLAAGAAHYTGLATLAQALLGACLAGPWILSAWLVRRAFYLQGQARQAALASLLFAFCLLAGLWTSQQNAQLTPLAAYLWMGASSLLICLLFGKKVFPIPNQTILALNPSELWAAQWGYARWSAGTAVLIWVPLNVFFLLPYIDGLQGPAALRAISNTLTPLMQSTMAITTLTLPQLAKTYSESGSQPVLHATQRFLGGFVGLAALYWLLLAGLHEPIFRLLYVDQYHQASRLLLFAGAVPLLFGVVALLENSLRAMERPRQVMQGYLIAALLAVSLGTGLTLSYGIAGALIGQALAFAAAALFLYRDLQTVDKAI